MGSKILIPIAILVAGGIIAFAIVTSDRNESPTPGANVTAGDFGNSLSAGAQKIRPVSAAEHIRGNPDAPVTIVEFSDFECPFCRRLHPTLQQALEEFDGRVRWVYRHFPLTSIHSRAQEAAVASECAARLGGNDTFWRFSDLVFANQSRLGRTLYEGFAQGAGIPADSFNSCLASPDVLADVNADLQDAINSGGRGTPFVVVIGAQGELFPFSGALPYEQVRQIILRALQS